MFDIERAGEQGRVIVKLQGEIDLATVEKVNQTLSEALTSASDVNVDLSGVSFLDSSGIRALVQAYRQAESAGARLYVTGAQDWVARVLEVTGVAGLLSPRDGS